MQQLLRRVWYFIRQRRFETDLAEELEFHRAMKQQELERDGVPGLEAASAARRQLGNETLAREDARAIWTWLWLQHVLQDMRYALRTLARNPRFTTLAIVILALGIGATTTVLSVAYGVLMRPLPYPDSDRLVSIGEEHPGADAPIQGTRLTNLTYHAWVEAAQTLDGMAVYSVDRHTIGLADEPARISAAAVSASLFPLLGQSPAHGRLFGPEDGRSGAPSVTVISHELWRERFGGRPEMVGQSLIIDGRAHTVIGVARPGFHFPNRDAKLWMPKTVPLVQGSGLKRDVSDFYAIGRLKRGVAVAQAEAEGTAAARSTGPRPFAAEMLFGSGGPVVIRVRPLIEEQTKEVRPALMVLTIGVIVLLIVACANVANLSLSRGLTRQREIAVRAALGASTGRLIRQLFTESAVVALMGGFLGFFLAYLLLRSVPALVPSDFPRVDAIDMDTGTLVIAAAGTILTALISGLLPALRCGSFAMPDRLQWSHRGSSRGEHSDRLRDVLLIAEAALATVLIVGAALLGRSFLQLSRVDAGYDVDNVVTARIYLPTATPERKAEILDTLLIRLRAVPGVLAAGGGNMMPFGESTYFSTLVSTTGAKPTFVQAMDYSVTPGYAEALGLRLRQGRLFSEQDTTDPIAPVLVNEEFMRQWQSVFGHSIVGRRFNKGLARRTEPSEIVGVVANVLKDGPDRNPQPEVYQLQKPGRPLGRELNVVVRTAGGPAVTVSLMRSLLRSIDQYAALEAEPLTQQVATSVSRPRLATIVLTTFAMLAVLLASIGLYGVLSYNISQRRRELGVRAALGAQRSDLIRQVLFGGLARISLGVTVGLALAAALTRLIESLLFGVKPLDAMAFAAGPMVLLPIALVACLFPAFRAASTDPAEILRWE